MMKTFSTLALAVLALGLATGTAPAQTRIGTVELRKLFDNYWKTKQADAALKERAADLDKEFKGLRDDYAKSREQLQKLVNEANDQAVSAEEREKRKKAADAKLKEVKDTEETMAQFEKSARTTLEEQRKRMRDNILTEIRNVIDAKAKAGNYTLVIDVSAETLNNTPVVLYFNDPKNDLTQTVLEQLNLGQPVETGRTGGK